MMFHVQQYLILYYPLYTIILGITGEMGGGGEEGMFDGIVDYKVQMPSRMFESGSYVVAVRRSNYIRSIVIVQIYLFY